MHTSSFPSLPCPHVVIDACKFPTCQPRSHRINVEVEEGEEAMALQVEVEEGDGVARDDGAAKVNFVSRKINLETNVYFSKTGSS